MHGNPVEGKEPDTCRGEGLCGQSVPSSPEHASFLPTQLKPWTRGATFINRACWLPSGGCSCQGLDLNPASIPSQLSDLRQGPSLRKRRLVRLPGAYQESQSERVKGLSMVPATSNISPDRNNISPGQARPNYRYPEVTFQPLVTLDRAKEAWATHQRKGLPGVSHMVSARRLAHSLFSSSSAGPGQLEAAPGSRGGEGKGVGLS